MIYRNYNYITKEEAELFPDLVEYDKSKNIAYIKAFRNSKEYEKKYIPYAVLYKDIYIKALKRILDD